MKLNLLQALKGTPGTLEADRYTDELVTVLTTRLEEALEAGGDPNIHCTVPHANMLSVQSALSDLIDPEQLLALVQHGRGMLMGASFLEEDIIAIRLYTGTCPCRSTQ